MKKSLQYKAIIQEIPAIRKDLDILQGEWSIPNSEMGQIRVMIEEIFSNIVRFGYRDSLEHHIDIILEKRAEEVTIELIDDGIPFNPLEYHQGPVTDPAASEDGGMGITLIRTFSNSLYYEREGDFNHLHISKQLKSNTTSG